MSCWRYWGVEACKPQILFVIVKTQVSEQVRSGDRCAFTIESEYGDAATERGESLNAQENSARKGLNKAETGMKHKKAEKVSRKVLHGCLKDNLPPARRAKNSFSLFCWWSQPTLLGESSLLSRR